MEQPSFKRLLTRTFALPFIQMALLAATFLWLGERQDLSLKQVDQTDRVIGDTRLLMKLVVDMESGLRGYLLTGDRTFLHPYEKAAPQIEDKFNRLEKMVSADPPQVQKVQQVRMSFLEWKQYSQEMIVARESGGDYQSLAVNLRGKEMMDRVRARRDEFLQAVEDLRGVQVAAVHRDARVALAIGAVLTLLLAALLAYTIRGQIVAISDTYGKTLEFARELNVREQETRKQLDAVLASMAEGLYQLDSEGRLVYLNPAGERLLGYRLEEIRGKNMHDVVHARTPEGENRPWQECPLVGVVKQGMPYHAPEDYLTRKDGSFLPVEVMSSPIALNQKVVGAVVTFRDLSERKRTEKALRASDKLATAGRLAASIAHEIQNPLDAVGNLLYTLGERPLDETSAQYVATARDELDRLAQITKHMLGLHRETHAPVPLKLTEVLDSLLALYECKIQAAKIRLEKRYDSAGEVRAFPGEMRQVFSNLLTNAIEALSGGGTIKLHVYSAWEWGNHRRPGTRVVIADTGIGIPAQYLEQIFEPFFTTKEEKGTGLGLWVSSGIVQKHEGSIRVRSSSRGTVFSVFLPS